MGRERVDPLDYLSEAWRQLRLSVRCPTRVPTWDAVVLTAASPAQAELYQRHLERAQANGIIARETVVLAVPDPEGRRIGSGAATIHALGTLAHHLQQGNGGLAAMAMAMAPLLLDQSKRVLLLHTGGDSKRVPWANPIGKAFIPLPFLAGDDPDGHIFTLFDHILAISASVLRSFSTTGGLLIMTGDVLPCFDGSSISLPENGAVVITVPASLSRASKHGVILSSQGHESELPLVMDLLQKPSAMEMAERGAVMAADGKALLDTGIFVVRGDAFRELVEFALLEPNPVADILAAGEEVSLYEEIAGAWVSARHEWLRSRPLGTKLIDALGRSRLHHHCAEELEFLHFGTSSEVLDHLSTPSSGRILRTQFSAIASSSTSSSISPSACVIGCSVDANASVGDNSLVFNCTLVDGVSIGSRCVAAGLSSRFTLPDCHCLWRVPVVGSSGSQVILCCGLDDDPKVVKNGDYRWKELGVLELDLWSVYDEVKSLWHAKLFPIVRSQEVGLRYAMWLMGSTGGDDGTILGEWRASERLSLSDVHSRIDFNEMNREVDEHIASLAAGFLLKESESLMRDRNVAQLCRSLALGSKELVDETLKESLTRLEELPEEQHHSQPRSRIYQAVADLREAIRGGDEEGHFDDAVRVWDAVAAETSAAVAKSRNTESDKDRAPPETTTTTSVAASSSRVELPVRVDIVGGWSDTPPWSLERTGCVLNMALQLNGQSPLSAEVTLHRGDGTGTGTAWVTTITDEAGASVTIQDRSSIEPPFHPDDRFRLVKAALVVTGFTAGGAGAGGGRLDVSTFSDVPRGSGLGVSSILAAAVVKALLEVKGQDASAPNVVRLVLVVEQIMGTGGGWQDQVGGVYPGIKCTTSTPGRPFMSLQVKPVPVSAALRSALHSRMLVVFTGQVRLAHKVLQIVVRRYLQRDARLIAAIERLAALAKQGEAAFAANDLDSVGRIMNEAWQLHLELDPNCSNTFVDSLFLKVKHLSCGHKLVGAGGGGFAIFIGKDEDATRQMKVLLQSVGPPVLVYDWNLFDH